MAYNLPPPGGEDGPPPPGPGFPGGFGFPGFGKSFSLDYGAGLGGGGIPGFFGGGFPGWGTPYVPVTPLGGLWGFKGDLIVPMVAIGVAIFIFILIVLAVKYALAWKLAFLEEIAGAKTGKFLRAAEGAPAEQLSDSNLNRLADAVAAAIYSEGCSKRVLCEIGSYAREGKQYPSLLRLMELVVPTDYHANFLIVRNSAEGSFDCAANYPCGDMGKNNKTIPADATNEIDVNKGKTNGQKMTSLPGPAPATDESLNQTKPGAAADAANPLLPHLTIDTTPAPSVFGKFKRTIFNK